MPNIWFTADFHLGHKNIIRYCNRPFDTVEEMNRTIIERLNGLVKTNDILYFLGDFCIGPKARAVELRSEIRCKKIFAVPGNHDKDTRKLTQEFSWLGDLVEVSINGQRIVLCHYAMRVWNHSCLVVNQVVGASNPLARPLLSPAANLSYMTSSCEYGSLLCSPRSPNKTALRNPWSALNRVRHQSFTAVGFTLWASLRVAAIHDKSMSPVRLGESTPLHTTFLLAQGTMEKRRDIARKLKSVL